MLIQGTYTGLIMPHVPWNTASFDRGKDVYFVVIDLQQLYTRLFNSGAAGILDAEGWLAAQDFKPVDGGWIGSAASMNSLSCSEILYSERRMFDLPRWGRLIRMAS